MAPNIPDPIRRTIEPSARSTSVWLDGSKETQEAISDGPIPAKVVDRVGRDQDLVIPGTNFTTWKPQESAHGAVPDLVGKPHEANWELRNLLRRRLILVGWLGTWAHVSHVTSRLISPNLLTYDTAGPVLFAIYSLTAAAIVTWLAVVFASRTKGLRWHRGLEIGIWGVMAISRVGCDQLGYARYAGYAANSGNMFAYASILFWFGLVSLYGWLIPNTARRAAAIVAPMSLVATTSMLSLWLRLELRPGQLTGFLNSMVFFMGASSALAVLTAGRLETARQAIVRAREVGQYRLRQRLGGGGMGEVFLAEHRLLKRPWAIKLIRPEKAGDETFVRRFEREVAAVTRLAHPSAVQVYDYGRAEDGAFFFVMEYLPGLALDDLVKRYGPLPPGRVSSVLRQVCGALSEAHGLGLVHRDVKPGNIMICHLGGRADVAKLLDFGLVAEPARQDTRLTQAGGLLGTPAYMSPEQARGAEVGPSSDLYSLGAVGYFLLTGRPPFDGKNPLELLHAHQNVRVVPPSAFAPLIPPDLETIVVRLLAKNPEDRYPTASSLERDLAACDPGGWSSLDAEAWWSPGGPGPNEGHP